MKTKLIAALLFIVMFMNACAPATAPAPTPDVNAIYTSAAKTVVAEFTLTAASFTATPFLPTETPTLEPPPATPTDAFTSDPTLAALGTPVALCDDYSFTLTTLDVTIPDGTTLTANQDFVKTWKIKNTGICTWDTGYGLIFSYGEKMSGKPVPLSINVAPEQEVDISVNLRVPGKAGNYFSAWQMVNPKGIPFGDKEHILLVKIVVQ
ncbi:MAG: NBR1-Ig-like domain-containing protein [Anaerolineales bacterium]|nr:NBR1-Ig-like domain-containing protein [Anaerolineales bacterium]